MKERIVVSSDHAGYDLKTHLKPFIESLGYEVEDVGTFNKEPVDYPEFTFKAAEKIISGLCGKGIVFCGTGQGDSMVANKVPGVRAALCWDEFTARMSRAHNDANVLVLGGWVTGHRVAEEMVRVWLATPFEGGRHQRRISQIREIEKRVMMQRGKIYDITQTISPGMLSWPGEQKVVFNKVEFEGVASLTHLDMSAHTGTHVDAMAHIISGGGCVDEISLEKLTGRARVCNITGTRNIDRAALSSLPLEGVSRLLLCTGNSSLLKSANFNKNYVALTEDAATYLVEKGIIFLAVDYLSVDEFETSIYPVHRALLNAGAVIVEGVNLAGVPAGEYEMLCLPLKLEGCDGAPSRIVLRTL